MTEQEKEKCRWKSEYNPEYTCEEPVLVDGYCILHYADDDKDLDSFKRRVEEKLNAEDDRIHLEGCYFPSAFGKEYFKECNFNKIIYFNEATFSQGANFFGADFLYVDFSKAKFSGDVNFVGVSFNVSPDFEEATFAGMADFQSFFEQDANFKNAKFHKANFSGADFCGTAEFSESHFEGEANFTGVIFKETSQKAEFKDVVFNSKADFSGIYCQDTKLDFTGSTFKGRTLFTSYFTGLTQEVEFGQVVFNNVNFLGQTIFQHIDLSHCSFLHSNMDKVDFRYCKFAERPRRVLWFDLEPRQNVLRDELDADSACHSERSEESRPFANAQGDTGVESGVKDEDVIARDAVPKQSLFDTVRRLLRFARNDTLREEKYEPVRRLYLELKRNFEDKKDWNTAGDFHYGEMECRRKGRLGGWLDFLLVNAYYWASGYGERPWRAFVLWLFSTLLFFPLLYRLSEHDPLSACVWDSVRIATFMKIGVPIEPESWGRIILTLEYLICPALLALFALALRRKVKR